MWLWPGDTGAATFVERLEWSARHTQWAEKNRNCNWLILFSALIQQTNTHTKSSTGIHIFHAPNCCCGCHFRFVLSYLFDAELILRTHVQYRNNANSEFRARIISWRISCAFAALHAHTNLAHMVMWIRIVAMHCDIHSVPPMRSVAAIPTWNARRLKVWKKKHWK